MDPVRRRPEASRSVLNGRDLHLCPVLADRLRHLQQPIEIVRIQAPHDLVELGASRQPAIDTRIDPAQIRQLGVHAGRFSELRGAHLQWVNRQVIADVA